MNRSGNALFSLLLVWLATLTGFAQPGRALSGHFSHTDSLRGSLRPERTCYDVLFYDLSVRVDPATKYIEGSNRIRYKVVEPFRRLQVDLFANMAVKAIQQNGKPLSFVRDGNAIFIIIIDPQVPGAIHELTIDYGGAPQVAINPPWDGGFIWRNDSTAQPATDWVTVACEGTGASLWWPNKDHLSDEPDSMRIRCQVPAGLMCVSNGKLIGQKPSADGRQTEWTWFVHYPINNYNVTLNITNYAHIADTYTARDGKKLALDYYVLPAHVQKASVHFKQVKTMLACYETFFGKYPFWHDGYKLVETPYWGMEHQSAIAYGNRYHNDAFGFDFIIIHESGHEYFGNSLSCTDQADMWIHESFTTYAEALYVEYTRGKDWAMEYLNSQRNLIKNTYPMVGPSGVNYEPKDTDIYYKGTWMLHTLRQAIGNDINWFATLKALATEKRLSTVYTAEIIDFLCHKTGIDLRPIFSQYLYHSALPTLEYKLNTYTRTLSYRWVADAAGFNLPVKLKLGPATSQTIRPTSQWQMTKLDWVDGSFTIDRDTGLFDVALITLE